MTSQISVLVIYSIYRSHNRHRTWLVILIRASDCFRCVSYEPSSLLQSPVGLLSSGQTDHAVPQGHMKASYAGKQKV
jgi:hypothetical protein